MRNWIMAVAAAAAIAAGCSTDADAHMAGSGRAAGFAHGGFRARLFAGNRFGFDFGRGFGYGRYDGFENRRFPGNGETAAGDGYAGGYDDSYAEDEGAGLENMHFRVQDSFGPWDIGGPRTPEEPYDSRPWDAARMAPWQGYEPNGAW